MDVKWLPKDDVKYLLNDLESQLADLEAEEKQFGRNDRIVAKKMIGLLACKEMVERLIGCPVNLGLDGKVTLGL